MLCRGSNISGARAKSTAPAVVTAFVIEVGTLLTSVETIIVG